MTARPLSVERYSSSAIDPAPRPIFTTRPRATFYGHGQAGVCCPSDWSDAQAVTFAESDASGYGTRLRVTSLVRVPCDCRPGFVHIQLGEQE